MFRKEINFISDLNLNRLQDLGDKFSINDIKRINIHPTLIQYIEAAVDYEIFNDRRKIEDDTIFDYSSDRINNYFSLISEEIKRTQLFPQSYIRQLLQTGIIFNLNYLIKPHRALTKLIFDEAEIKSIDEIVLGLSHCYYYQYLKKIILTYLEKKKVLIMRKDEFFSLLLKIDSISKQTHLVDTIVTSVNSMANFFDQNSKTSEKIPIHALKLYLKERKLGEFLQCINNNYDEENNSSVLATKIIKEFKSVIPETEIEIDESQKFEDQLIADNSDEVEIKKESVAPTQEYIDDNSGQNEILDVDEDDDEIPNNELLSDEHVSVVADEGNDEKSEDEIINDIEEDINDNNIGEDEPSKNDLKKKPNPIILLKKLFNLNSIYDSLLSKPKPFDDIINYKEKFFSDVHLKGEIDYKLDHFTLSDRIEISSTSDSTIKTDNSEPLREIEKDRIEENEEIVEKRLSVETDEFENTIEDDSDIETSIDEIVGDESIEKEFIAENKTMEVIEQDLINAEELTDPIDNEEDIVFDKTDEELTEVFTDLAFLEKNEESSDIDSAERQESENQNTDTVLENVEESLHKEEEENYSSFEDMIEHKDMTKIIEFIFDYDMEDYHLALNTISSSGNEEEVIDFIENYCKNNHIDTDSNEVNQFKSLISDYYAQAYS